MTSARLASRAILQVAVVTAAFLLTLPLATATNFLVTNTNDSGAGSLRQAMTDANATSGADTILFQIPGTDQKTITRAAELPAITESVTVDGANNGDQSSRVQLSAAGVIGSGLQLTNGIQGMHIKNLVINGFGQGILCGNVQNSTIAGNYIGVNSTGTGIVPHSGIGIQLFSSSNILIGGSTAAARNVISSVEDEAINITASYAIVQGNYIGAKVMSLSRRREFYSVSIQSFFSPAVA